MADLPSIAHMNVEPGTVDVNRILALRSDDFFFGALLTMTSGTGQAAWVVADPGQRSCVTSPKPSPSTSGSRTAETLGRTAGKGVAA